MRTITSDDMIMSPGLINITLIPNILDSIPITLARAVNLTIITFFFFIIVTTTFLSLSITQ